MKKYNIPTAAYENFDDPEKALEYKEKWLNARNEQNKNITHRNA